MCYTIDRGVIVDARNLPNLTTTPEEIASLFENLGFDVFIAGDMTSRLRKALESVQIEPIADVYGSAREVVDNYLNNAILGTRSLLDIHREAVDPEDAGVDKVLETLAQKAANEN